MWSRVTKSARMFTSCADQVLATPARGFCVFAKTSLRPAQRTKTYLSVCFCVSVPETGLEPARLSAHPPQGCLSTNFNTRARMQGRVYQKTTSMQSRLMSEYTNTAKKKNSDICRNSFLIIQLLVRLLFLRQFLLELLRVGHLLE